jgi:hypothetical protein
MRSRYAVAVLLAVLYTASGVGAQPFWEKKNYTQWSKGDCQRMLNDSPWGKKEVVFTRVMEDRFGQPTGGDARQAEQHITYTVQFRSARPMRQAVVRLAALDNKYDKMDAAQKRAFDESAQAFIDGSFSDTIVIAVEYGSNVQFYERELMRFWHDFKLAAFHNQVYLTTSSGQRVAPQEWKHAPGGSLAFQLVFPRLLNNEPWVRPHDKWIRLEFPHPKFDDLRQEASGTSTQLLPTTLATFEFKLERMKWKNDLVY